MTDKGYYAAPNTTIPLNDRAPGEIADIAWEQLRPFREAALTWPVHHTYRDKRYVNLCRVCDENIWFSTDPQGQMYTYTEEEILALIVAHIRQVHERMISDQETATRPEMSLQNMQESGESD